MHSTLQPKIKPQKTRQPKYKDDHRTFDKGSLSNPYRTECTSSSGIASYDDLKKEK